MRAGGVRTARTITAGSEGYSPVTPLPKPRREPAAAPGGGSRRRTRPPSRRVDATSFPGHRREPPRSRARRGQEHGEVALDGRPGATEVLVRDPGDSDVETAELVLAALLLPQHPAGFAPGGCVLDPPVEFQGDRGLLEPCVDDRDQPSSPATGTREVGRPTHGSRRRTGARVRAGPPRSPTGVAGRPREPLPWRRPAAQPHPLARRAVPLDLGVLVACAASLGCGEDAQLPVGCGAQERVHARSLAGQRVLRVRPSGSVDDRPPHEVVAASQPGSRRSAAPGNTARGRAVRVGKKVERTPRKCRRRALG